MDQNDTEKRKGYNGKEKELDHESRNKDMIPSVVTED